MTLKVANIKVTAEGKVKVLDFGLAKAYQQDPANAHLSNSPTMASGGSLPGMILGTAAYMSPEQAKGREVDKRTDILAFGCVLYEMLTGRRAFDGDDVADILSAVLRSEPDWTRLPVGLPSNVRNLLRLCLEKNVKNRRSSATDVRLDIELALKEPPEAGALPAASRTREGLWMGVAAVFLIAIAALAIPTVRYLREVPPPEMRVDISTPSTPAPLEFALSPDGRHIVFVASGDGSQRLWLRTLDKTDAQPMPGTEGADFPFWSADSRSIGFTAAGKIKRIDIAGGPPQILANTGQVRGGAWNAAGTILFTVTSGALFRTTASGGEPVAVTRLGQAQAVQEFPQFLPDGRQFLYYVLTSPEGAGIYLGSLDGGESKRLAAADSAAAYLPPEMIAFVRGTSLMVQHFDLKRGELTGDPMRLADPIGLDPRGTAGFSVSSDGRLAYRGGGGALRQFRWYDLTGKVLGVGGQPDSASPLYPELSPDGARVALYRLAQNNGDVWLTDLLRGGMTRLTFDPGIDSAPVWSPDGMRIAFFSSRKGPSNLYLKPSSGAGAEELLLESPNAKAPQDWSKDGRFLLYREADPKTGRDLWALPVTGNDRKPIVVVKTPFEELNGQFSPDGRWVAYETNESGRFEIAVQPFPAATGKWQVSTDGGIQPRWRADGKELYFVAPDGKLMAASITAGAAFAAGTPAALFPAALAPGSGSQKQQYAVSRDGRFLISQVVEASSAAPITLILNWKPPAK